jgi:hypothetical protein
MRKNQKPWRRTRLGGKAQAAHPGEIEGAALHLGDYRGKDLGAQGFLEDPQKGLGLRKGNGQKPVARQAQGQEPMAVKPSPFGIAMAKPAPEKRVLAIFKAAQSEAECETHGGRRVRIGSGCDLMQGICGKTLRRQMLINGAYTEIPRRTRRMRLESEGLALDCGNTPAQSGQRRRRFGTWLLDGKISARNNGLRRLGHVRFPG